MERSDSEPDLVVNVIGTATSDGQFTQHEAVIPQKARAALVDPATVVVRSEAPSAEESVGERNNGASGGTGLLDATSSGDEITSITKARLRAQGWGLYRVLWAVENHRLAALSFALGSVLLLLAALMALR